MVVFSNVHEDQKELPMFPFIREHGISPPTLPLGKATDDEEILSYIAAAPDWSNCSANPSGLPACGSQQAIGGGVEQVPQLGHNKRVGEPD